MPPMLEHVGCRKSIHLIQSLTETRTLSLQTFACVYMPEDSHFGGGQAKTRCRQKPEQERDPQAKLRASRNVASNVAG
jgi:hypothetical protein